VQKEGIKQQIPFPIFVLYNTTFAYIPRYHSQPKEVFISLTAVTVLHVETIKIHKIKYKNNFNNNHQHKTHDCCKILRPTHEIC